MNNKNESILIAKDFQFGESKEGIAKALASFFKLCGRFLLIHNLSGTRRIYLIEIHISPEFKKNLIC